MAERNFNMTVNIPQDEFRRLVNDIKAFVDDPRLPNVMARIAVDTLRMYDLGELPGLATRGRSGMDYPEESLEDPEEDFREGRREE